jgi:hypothetical protein
MSGIEFSLREEIRAVGRADGAETGGKVKRSDGMFGRAGDEWLAQ